MKQDSIICGRAEEVLKGFPDACIDLTVTSPPYDGLRTYNGYTFDFEAIAAQLWRVTKPGGAVVWVVADETRDGSESGTSFRQALGFMAMGFKLHDTMIYERHTDPPHPGANRYKQAFEYMFVFAKGRPTTFNPIMRPNKQSGRIRHAGRGSKQRDGTIKIYNNPLTVYGDESMAANIWEYHPEHAIDHPAPFPEKLAEDHILSWSNEGDLILDPMCGSGTTCKMAIRHRRRFIGIDISEAYCDLARRRIAAVQPTMFDLARL